FLLVIIGLLLSLLLFPYTTLFRSCSITAAPLSWTRLFSVIPVCISHWSSASAWCCCSRKSGTGAAAGWTGPAAGAFCAVTLRCRSEEHTSELQSRGHLVCRLLLEK